MRDQKLKTGDFRRPRPNVRDQKSPELPLDLTLLLLTYVIDQWIGKC